MIADSAESMAAVYLAYSNVTTLVESLVNGRVAFLSLRVRQQHLSSRIGHRGRGCSRFARPYARTAIKDPNSANSLGFTLSKVSAAE